jgi:hypothetical protein
MICGCGDQATHKIEVAVSSLRGVAYRLERGCARCMDRLAWRLLAAGAAAVIARAA